GLPVALKTLMLVSVVALLSASSARGADWKPAKSPLMTRWAKDVSPEKVWPEYPRPQMARKEWMNLNGLWQFAPAGGAADTTAETQARGKQTPTPRSIWYTPCSGIWQTVWLEPVPSAYVKAVKITPDVDAGTVRFTVTLDHPDPDIAVNVWVKSGGKVIAM